MKEIIDYEQKEQEKELNQLLREEQQKLEEEYEIEFSDNNHQSFELEGQASQFDEFSYRKQENLKQMKQKQQLQKLQLLRNTQNYEIPQKKDITFGPFEDQDQKQIQDKTKKEGWVYKKANSIFFSWQKRYAEVGNKTFKYYHKESDKKVKPAGIINFDFVSVNVSIIDENSFEFVIKPINQNRVFYMQCKNKEDLSE